MPAGSMVRKASAPREIPGTIQNEVIPPAPKPETGSRTKTVRPSQTDRKSDWITWGITRRTPQAYSHNYLQGWWTYGGGSEGGNY